MRFLADAGVSLRVVKWLRSAGHDALHLLEEGLASIPDEDVFAKARLENRILLTFDLDFGEIVSLTHGKAVPVIVFRLRNTSTEHVIERLAAVLKPPLDSLQDVSVVIVEEARFRIRKYPFSSG
jgi:predicted nuclease of predicted toxin-antitoxin system